MPKEYGIEDDAMPEGLWAQIAYPLVQRGDAARPAAEGGLAQKAVQGAA
jgi:hypothetical protein